MITTNNREIQETAENDYSRRRQYLVAAFLVATLGATAEAELLTFIDPTPTTNGHLGYSVALDGNNVLIGVFGQDANAGQAHLFDATTGSLLQTFNNPTPVQNDHFGVSVALDGNNVLIGAYGDDTYGDNVGQSYLFDATTGSLLKTFNDPTVTTSDHFGRTVALDGNNVLIGASSDDTNGDRVGQAYLFDATTGNLLQTFNDPTPTDSDHFGYSVALDGNRVLIGASGDDTNGTNAGQAHLFTISALAADFDGDGDTDGADFLNWQRGRSPDPLSAGDLAAWHMNYGAGNPLSASSTVVPEPSSLILVLTAVVRLLIWRSSDGQVRALFGESPTPSAEVELLPIFSLQGAHCVTFRPI